MMWRLLSRAAELVAARPVAVVRRTRRDRRIAALRRQLEAATAQVEAARTPEAARGWRNDVRELTEALRSELAAAGSVADPFGDEGTWHPVDLDRGGLGDLFRNSRYPTGRSGGGLLGSRHKPQPPPGASGWMGRPR